MVQLFVQALNIPGSVPNFQNTWDIFVETTCGEAVKESIEMYKVEMASRVKNKIPCDADMLRLANEEVMQKCVQNFLTKTASLSTNSIKEFQEDLQVKASSIFEEYIRQNKEQTTAGCRDLLKNLKKEKWQPILIRLRGPSASKMEFKEVVEAYDAVKNEYQSKAKGAKNMIQDVFMEFLPEFKKEMEQNHDILKLMKGYDADIKNQKAMNAAIEKVQKENEERIAMMEDQMRAKQRQLADLTNKIKEDQIKLQEELAKKELENKNQMKNMVAAHQDQMRESRDRFQKQQENLETRLQGMEKALRDKDQEIKILTSKTDEYKNRSIVSLLAEAGVKIVEKVVDKCCVS